MAGQMNKELDFDKQEGESMKVMCILYVEAEDIKNEAEDSTGKIFGFCRLLKIKILFVTLHK